MRDRFTSALQQALVEAQSLAVGRDHGYIEPAHLLLALVDQSGGTTRTLLNSAGANLATLRSALERALDQLARIKQPTGDVKVSPDLARLLNLADRLAQS